MPEKNRYETAVALMDAANGEDPNRVEWNGETWPKERLYSRRMVEMLERFDPTADEAMKLAVRAQHIQRWRIPRSDFPEGRQGYLQWRTRLYRFHADTAGEILARAGYDDATRERVKQAVGKRGIKVNPDSQLLEDVADLVFIEYYLEEFAAKHPEYSEEKWLDIIRKTWKKMSERAREFALSGAVKLPEALKGLIRKAVG